MINYSNYARSIELLPYISVNEAKIGHASDDSAIGFDKLMGGALTGSAYTTNYNAFVDAISASIDKGDKSGTVEVKHDDGSHFLNVRYTIDYANPNDIVVNLYRTDYTAKAGKAQTASQTATAGKTTGAAVAPSAEIDKAALYLAIALASGVVEDEDAVYRVFTDQIKSDAQLRQLLSYWESLKLYIPKGGGLFGMTGGFFGGIDQNDWTKVKADYAEPKKSNVSVPVDPKQYSLQYWLSAPKGRKDSGGDLFNADEMKKLNEIIKKYSSFQFQVFQ